MTTTANLEQFKREARAAAAAVPLEWRDRAVRLAAFAYEELIRNTEDSGSVDTGAYRAEHVIEQNGAPIFENPERPGPTQQFPSRKALGLGPIFSGVDRSAVEAALESGLALGGFSFVNRRFYADKLEYGDAQIEPRLIYKSAQAATAAYAEVLAAEGPRRPELRKLA